MMPEMDGFELIRKLRERHELADVKIIVLSAKGYDFDRRRAKELGADGYLTKPFQREALLESIASIVSNHMVVTYWGVHGTLPTPGEAYTRYGGNTPCVSVEIGDEPLTIFDCGSGIKRLSDHIMRRGTQRFSARIFISHTHWDHITPSRSSRRSTFAATRSRCSARTRATSPSPAPSARRWRACTSR
jgi:hypothetical protein